MTVIGAILVIALLSWGLVTLGRRLFRTRAARPQAAPETTRADRGPVRADYVRAGPAAAAARPAASTPADRRVKVLMLGDSGSGKTTMLASMYHTFALGGTTGIRFATDDGANRHLLRLVSTIRDASQAVITAGTRPAETRTWEFAVRVESGDQEATAFVLEYLDYPGGYVENRLRAAGSGDPPDPRFEEALASADVLMGVLDGEKISKLMSGVADLRVILSVENLLNLLIRAEQRNIHLVVTKWDLVRGPGGAFHSISEVLDKLDQESAAFRAFRRSPRLGNMRVIPVSALGLNGFVRADPAVPGGMAKVAGKSWQPWNAQVPFFCAVPDILRHDAAKLAGRLSGNIARITRVVLDVVQIAAMKVSVGGLISIDIPVAEILARIWRQVHDTNERGMVPAVLSGNAAISYVLNECFAHVEEFERQFPDSRPRWPGARA